MAHALDRDEARLRQRRQLLAAQRALGLPAERLRDKEAKGRAGVRERRRRRRRHLERATPLQHEAGRRAGGARTPLVGARRHKVEGAAQRRARERHILPGLPSPAGGRAPPRARPPRQPAVDQARLPQRALRHLFVPRGGSRREAVQMARRGLWVRAGQQMVGWRVVRRRRGCRRRRPDRQRRERVGPGGIERVLWPQIKLGPRGAGIERHSLTRSPWLQLTRLACVV